MSPAERTLADEFNDAGYSTIYVGKWHLDGNCGDVVPRERQGRWQRWIGHEHQTGIMNPNGPGHLHRDIALFDSRDNAWHRTNGYSTDCVVDETIQAIRDECRSGKPFCCVCSVLPPHPPLDPPKDTFDNWRGRPLTLPPNLSIEPKEYPEVRGQWFRAFNADDVDYHWRTYYAMVENIDSNIGRLVQFLEDDGFADNTIVMYVSDHGELAGCHGLRGKQFPFEESIGIPLIIYDPRQPEKNGRIIEEPVGTEDLFPTITGLCGLPPRNDLLGQDCTPLLQGKQSSFNRPGVLLEYVRDDRHNHAFHDQGWRGIRTSQTVYTVIDGRPWHYFNLKNDPHQMNNLIDEPDHQKEIAQHHQWLEDLLVQTGDHYQIDGYK